MFSNQRGQVGVIVAILMVSLIVAVIIIIQVYYVPNWMKEKESDHMDTVGNQFSNLKFSIDLQTMAQMDVPITNSITLGSKELPYFVSARAFGSLNVISADSSNFSVLITGKGKKESTPHTSSGLSSNTIKDITFLDVFELQLSSLSAGDIFEVSVDGSNVISVSVYNEIDVGFRIALKTTNATVILFNQTIAAALPPEPYTINLLDDMYKFSTYLASEVDTPFNISYTGTVNSEFTVHCHNYTNTGLNIEYNLGTIEYLSENSYFVDQTYSYQGGAIIVGQSDGEAIISPPFFSISNDTTKHVINVSVVNVQGLSGKRAASGYGTYGIRTNYSTNEQKAFIARNITLTITTDYSTAWERYINSTVNATGMQYGQDYLLNATEHQVVLDLYGPKAGLDTDLIFQISKINIYAQVGPGWIS